VAQDKFLWKEGDLRLLSQPNPAKRGEKSTECTKGKHFHVFASDVFEKQNFSMVFECATANEALERSMKWLPNDWEGSLEIDDDKSNSLSKAPLIDFWRTPL